MPVVSVPVMLLDPPGWTDVRVQSRKDSDIFRELALMFPHIERKLVAGGEPRWVFTLIRARDGSDLRYEPDRLIDADERLELLPMVGC